MPSNPARCAIDIHEVVAVTDGWALWKLPPFENNVRLDTEDGSGLYYVYLHMSPQALQDAGLQRGVPVAVSKGQVIGKVGNFEHADAGGTSTHLHFEIRRQQADAAAVGPTLSPYMTLIRAYERLIGATGTEIAE